MEQDTTKSLEHVEFETKYRVDAHILTEFKRILDAITEPKTFIYVEGPDSFFVNPAMDDSFARYRQPSYGLDHNRKEVTFKIKPKGAKNNIIRTEYNWRVDTTPEESIKAALNDLGFKFNCKVWKTCHIYKLDDATLVFYSVYDLTDDKPAKFDNFVEIEVSEEKLKDMTEEQAWEVIKKYEILLAPLGVNPQKRLRKSLFEMYRRTTIL